MPSSSVTAPTPRARKLLPAEDLAQLVPLRRLGRPDEVAALIGFLFSPEAAYMTAQVLGIDGGMT